MCKEVGFGDTPVLSVGAGKMCSYCVQGEVLWVQFPFVNTERVVAHSLIPEQCTVDCQAEGN